MERKASADADLERRARMSMVWQDLVTPVRAIVGYQEIIVEEGRRLGLDDVLPYLDKVLASASALNDMVEGLRTLPSADMGPPGDHAGVQARLRHDLRTPLNAIIGYSEMVLEDLDRSAGVDSLRGDIEKLLQHARRLLGDIDAIVDLQRSSGAGRLGDRTNAASAGTEATLAALLLTLRPERDAVPIESGRILVVDDNDANRELLCRRLEHEGHRVTTAESGRRAFELLQDAAFDLILLDLIMPGMNGIEVLERLKSDERTRHVPAIMISALSEMDAVIRCIEAGADDYLPKPFNLVLLRARINAALERTHWRERERDYLHQLQAEKQRSETLLRNILPEPVIKRLNSGETTIADGFEEVSILFADLVGFTPAAARMSPSRTVERLDRLFREFDALAQGLGVEKIKTIGDAYMAAAGLPEPRADHAQAIVTFGIGILDALERIEDGEEHPLQVRIGIHCGPAVAGIIGRHKFIYDVWGDTVNVASRLESQGVPNRIQVSQPIRDALSHLYGFEPRGEVALKGKGSSATYLLVCPDSAIRLNSG